MHRAHRDSTRAALLLVAAGSFVVLTAVAMLAYPGGARYRFHSSRYLFFDNFLSDLGATETLTGAPNAASRILFVIALVALGVALAWFGPTWRTLDARRGAATAAGHIAQLLAVLTGAGLVGIAFTPWNRALDAHEMFVRVAFALLYAYIVCLTVLLVRNGWPRRSVLIDLGYLVLHTAYIAATYVGPNLDTLGGVRFQATAQKVVVYASIVALVVQATFVRTAARARAAYAVSTPQSFAKNSVIGSWESSDSPTRCARSIPPGYLRDR
jgi:hypothetical protein